MATKLCDVCSAGGNETPALYDARIPHHCWANLCQYHFDLYSCKLGVGFGQRINNQKGVIE